MNLPPCSAEQAAVCEAVVSDGHNARVTAEAGAGKTTLFLYVIARWHASLAPDDARKVLLLSYNVALTAETARRVEAMDLQARVHVLTVHSLLSRLYGHCINDTISLQRALQRTDPPPCLPADTDYGLVLLDEAQDYDQQMVAGINVVLGLLNMATTRVVVVGDPRQTIYDFMREDKRNLLQDARHQLHAGPPDNWRDFQLLTSYRLTPATCAFVNRYFRHPAQPCIAPGNRSSANCEPRVVFGHSERGDLCRLLDTLVAQYGVDRVMVCAPSVNSRLCNRLCRDACVQLQLQIYSTHKQRGHVSPALLAGKLLVTTFHQSKGMEADCVLVIGLTDSPRQHLTPDPATGEIQPSNAVHVGVTRARQELVIFQDRDDEPYPTLQHLDDQADSTDPAVHRRKRASVPRNMGAVTTLRKHHVDDLVKFCSNEVVRHVSELLTISYEPFGDAISVRPSSDAHFTCASTGRVNVEFVADLFPLAVLWAAARMIYRAWGLERLMPIELQMYNANREHERLLPESYRAFWQRWRADRRLDDARGYLIMSGIYENCVARSVWHEMVQLRNFDWVGPREVEYFSKCVDAVVRAVNHLAPSGGLFQHPYMTRLQNAETHIIRGTAPFQPAIASAGCVMFSFDEDIGERVMLEAAVLMWLSQQPLVTVHLVTQGKLARVQAKSMDVVEAFVNHLIQSKN
jgi:hypothetical protein